MNLPKIIITFPCGLIPTECSPTKPGRYQIEAKELPADWLKAFRKLVKAYKLTYHCQPEQIEVLESGKYMVL